MNRRDLIKGAGLGLAAGMLNTARAADLPVVKWRLEIGRAHV